MNYEQFENHTPGPWKVDFCRSGWSVDPVMVTLDIEARYGAVTNVADARLIAAAPDLLAENKRLREALQNIINTPPLKLTHYSPAEWWHRLVEDMCDQARTALQEEKR